VEETFSGHNIVKAFNGTDEVYTQFHDINKKLHKNMFMSQFLTSLMGPVMNFTSKFVHMLVTIIGIVLIVKGNINVGILLSFFAYINIFQQQLMQFGQVTSYLQTGTAASERVHAFLAEKDQTSETHLTKKIDAKKIKGDIVFSHVKFGYLPKKTIINDFSLHVKPGQKIAIVGPTGAGKTTIINLIMRFYELNGGTIKVDGIPTNTIKREDVRKLFGMVLQDT
jgi:ATP-binding cassette subfamily B protein